MNDIDNILEKYFDGESSVEEEQSLIHYFQSESVSEEHVKYVPIFQHFAKEKEVNKSVKRTETFKLTRLYLAIASCAALLLGIVMYMQLAPSNDMKSIVYVDGKRIHNKEIFKAEVLNTIISIEEKDAIAIESQIDILDTFLE